MIPVNILQLYAVMLLRIFALKIMYKSLKHTDVCTSAAEYFTCYCERTHEEEIPILQILVYCKLIISVRELHIKHFKSYGCS